jgi:hypothetical protein
MTPKQFVYLALAITGLCTTWYHNIAFMQETGGVFALGAFIDGVYANHASSSIGWDITVACIAFLVWMTGEARQLGMKHAWAYVVLTFGVAFAFAAPLFLFMRERHLAARRPAGTDAAT